MNQGNRSLEKNLIHHIRISGIKLITIPIILIMLIGYLLIKIPFSDILVPKTVDNLNTLSLDTNKSIEYFSISSSEWLYSGYNNYKDNKILEYIYYHIDNETCYFLLVSPEHVKKSDMSLKNKNITVSIMERSDSFNSFLTEFATDINWNFKALNEASSSIILSTSSYNITLYKIFFAALIIMLLYLIFFKLYLILIIIFPVLSPQLGSKHRHTLDSIRSRTEFAMLLQAELDNYIFKADDMYITQNYIINLTTGELCIIPLNKLCFTFEHGNLHKFLWLYMKVTHTIYFLCSNSLKCHFTHKNSGQIDTIMSVLKETIPDLMVGYSTENQMRYIEIIKEHKSK